jgi:hypothetical protein
MLLLGSFIRRPPPELTVMPFDGDGFVTLG